MSYRHSDYSDLITPSPLRYGCGGAYGAIVEGDSVSHYSENGFLNPNDQNRDDANALKVKWIDMLIPANTRAHNTDEFAITEPDQFNIPTLVVRRGQVFDVEIMLNRAFDKEKDDLRLLFEIGRQPMPSKGTRVEIMLSAEDKPKQWGAWIKSLKGNTVVLTVITPPSCFIGIWSFNIDTKSKVSSFTLRFRAKEIYILLNPWCKDDLVFLNNEEEREEYVMNDTGKIFIGSTKSISGRPWNFGQFDPCVLECAMKLLDKSELGWSARGDPIKMIRKLTSVCNSPDNTGVLSGNWSGDYRGGSSPLKWTGSAPVLAKYYLSDTPVKYGQCWVFSGVLTSVCRALGIPARSVTNFASAHDADATITIDTYYDKDGKLYEMLNVDSVWNFHVWNEVWMARPDLPVGYGGWQAVDATPQETSEGIFCCGPASLVAIKRGEVNLPYDGPFIFAEVNADRVKWMKQDDGSWRTSLIKNSVGKFISTKKIGKSQYVRRFDYRLKEDPDRQDVTDLYKHPEGSQGERAAVLNAQKYNTSTVTVGAGQAYNVGPEDVEFEFMELDDVLFGKPFKVQLKAHNKAKQERTVCVTLAAWSVNYKGVQMDPIKSQEWEMALQPNARGEKMLEVTWDDYCEECADHAMIRMTCICKVAETKQVYVTDDDFTLRKPELQINCPDKAAVRSDVQVTFQFKNPINTPLTKCTLDISGPGLQDTNVVQPANVPANGQFKYTMTITPRKVGRNGKPRELIGKFSCKQIEDIDGQKSIVITPK